MSNAYEKVQSKVGNCRDCGESIIWLLSKSGKKLPVDYDESLVDEKEYDRSTMTCHFESCVKAPPPKPWNKGTCRDCSQPIIWIKTKWGKNARVEPSGVRDTDQVFDKEVHVFHDCKNKDVEAY